jgi:hypothetical protein
MPPRGQILPPPQPGMGYWPPPPWGYPTHPMGPWGRPHGQHSHFHHQRYVPDSCCLLLLFATNWTFLGLLHYRLYIWHLGLFFGTTPLLLVHLSKWKPDGFAVVSFNSVLRSCCCSAQFILFSENSHWSLAVLCRHFSNSFSYISLSCLESKVVSWIVNIADPLHDASF